MNTKIKKRMDEEMKNLVKGLVLAGVLGLGIIIRAGLNKPAEKVEPVAQEKVVVEFVWYQEGNVQELEGYYLEDGDTVVELTDGSWAISNRKINNYVFQPVELGDWDYTVDNAEQLENLIKTYLSMKNTGTF